MFKKKKPEYDELEKFILKSIKRGLIDKYKELTFKTIVRGVLLIRKKIEKD